ncbi:MAG TPA: ABC transporter ATP-binding protein [Candidatus Binatia bacterium]|jgi:oligopeptide/dipeptide ABC transporter ATP-binding protein|nr:ABC transporter ATP-binding protein [Candidatus Binatia bacterium]
MALLEVQDLRMTFPLEGGGEVAAVDRISFTLDRGRVLGLVGESGCGKSMTALCLLRLVPPPGRIAGGRILLDGRDLLALPEREMRRVRGAQVAMIFQEPMTALNPVLTVGSQVAEAVALHQPVSGRQAWERAVALLGEVGIPDAVHRAHDYPHQLSGGMRQRVMIAMAISCEPALLVADEPTTALDVTIQAEILMLLRRLRERRGMALLLITHDLGVVAEQADDVAIMYAGRIVERAPVVDLFEQPLHPYTQALLRSMPVLGRHTDRLETIPGQVPSLRDLPSGCAFRDRCPQAIDACAAAVPPLETRPGDRQVACIRA